jgi:hypothetical protein
MTRVKSRQQAEVAVSRGLLTFYFILCLRRKGMEVRMGNTLEFDTRSFGPVVQA